MPAKSKKQQMAAGAALAAKRGDKPKSSLKGASKQMAESMSETELKKMASVKRKKLPKAPRNRPVAVVPFSASMLTERLGPATTVAVGDEMGRVAAEAPGSA
jgi:hypothetical protein